jgi:hypothetical protein
MTPHLRPHRLAKAGRRAKRGERVLEYRIEEGGLGEVLNVNLSLGDNGLVRGG